MDLFALGIILFILFTGHPPFNQSHPTDTHYKLLVTNRADLFWKYHTKSKGEGFFSESFKDLITNMLQFNPSQRLNLVDIIGHPWMTEEIASEDEVKAEFGERHTLIKQNQEAEAAATQSQKQTKKKVNRDVKTGGKVFMNDEECEEGQNIMEESKDDQYAHLKMDTFNEATFLSKSTAIFSTHEPKYIFAKLQDALQSMETEAKRDEKKWKMTFEAVKAQNDEEIKEKIPSEGCRVTVKLLKVDEERVCIEFNRTMGNSWFFFDTVKQLKNGLKDVNDSAL